MIYYALFDSIWIYKVFKLLDTLQRCLFFTILFFIIIGLYKFGELINWIFWARRLKRKENITKVESNESEIENELRLFKETAL